MATVGSHQQGGFVIPINGTSPVDADEVRLNDNAMATTYNSHDADATLHVQSSTLSARPGSGTTGRLWFTTDEQKLYYDTGTSWIELKITANNVDSGTLPASVLPTVPVNKGGTGTATLPANGQLLIGNGTGYTLATITAGSNITVTNGPGGITVSASLAGGAINGTGTINTLPKWTGATTQADSQIQDNGTSASVGTAPDAAYKWKVGGAAHATGNVTSGADISATGDVTAGDDLIVQGNNASFNGVTYTMPSVQGANEAVLQNNGSGTLSWVVPTEPIDVQTFNSSGTWTKPSKGTVAYIEVWGAGGSGSAEANFVNRHGGAGGGYMARMLPLSLLGATETVTVGAGGASRTTAVAGQTGGNSNFGTWVYAYGGSGGYLGSAPDQAVTPGSALRAGRGGGTTFPIYVKGASLTATILAANFDSFDRTFAGGFAATDATDLGELKNSVWGGGAGSCKSLANAGTSKYGGDGGDEGVAGVAPGGGGGAATGTPGAGVSGAGGSGRVKITVW